MQSDSSNPATSTGTATPLRWRVGRILAICSFVGGALFATADCVPGLPLLAAGGGEVFGGAVITLAGVSSVYMLLTMTRNLIPRRTPWLVFAFIALCAGGWFLVIGFGRISHERAQLDAARKNLESIGRALEDYEARSKVRERKHANELMPNSPQQTDQLPERAQDSSSSQP